MSVRIYNCSSCGLSAPWGPTWRWRSAETFTNDVRRLLFLCREECAELNHQQIAWDRRRGVAS